jgi:hypothetical protein
MFFIAGEGSKEKRGGFAPSLTLFPLSYKSINSLYKAQYERGIKGVSN